MVLFVFYRKYPVYNVAEKTKICYNALWKIMLEGEIKIWTEKTHGFTTVKNKKKI